MENSFQTSFIPKKPIIDSGFAPTKNSSISISMVISVAILIIMVVAAGGLYFYKDYLQKNKDQLSADLLKISGSFNQATIAELEQYDKKTSTAKDILTKHVVLSPLFALLNELTLSSIQYTKFDHSTANNIFSVKMSGVARDYKSIANQADVFNTSKGLVFKDLIFSNLAKDKNNFVTFDLEFTVDHSLLSYSNNITNSAQTSSITSTLNSVDQTLPVNNGTQ